MRFCSLISGIAAKMAFGDRPKIMLLNFLSKTNPDKLKGVAILRLDFNSEGDWRLKRSLPTLKFLQKHAAKIVILSHKGRPTPSLLPLKENAKFSLKKDANKLSKFLNYPVNFINCSRISEAGNEIRNSKENSVFVLENVRFLEGEAENNLSLSEHLASLGDYFVNDAFAVSHRANASVVGITKFLPSYAGFEMEEELKNLSHIMEKPAHPFVMVFGGGKATDKLPIILNFRNKADFFLLGGALANTMLYLKGEKMGNSLIEKEIDGALPNLLKMKNVVLPFDFRKKGKAILDIGPKTEKLFSSYIKKAKTIVWNGPLGAFEKKGFEKGTKAIIKAIASSRAFSLVGGGETIVLLEKMKLEKKISFISTGGGAMLEFLSGCKLPGLKALEKSKK